MFPPGTRVTMGRACIRRKRTIHTRPARFTRYGVVFPSSAHMTFHVFLQFLTRWTPKAYIDPIRCLASGTCFTRLIHYIEYFTPCTFRRASPSALCQLLSVFAWYANAALEKIVLIHAIAILIYIYTFIITVERLPTGTVGANGIANPKRVI